MRKHTTIVLLAIASLGLYGCSEESPVKPPPRPPAHEYIFPDTENKAMENFTEAYGRLDLDTYTELLHPDFKFFFQEHDITTLGLLSDHLDRDGELGATTNMFSGEPNPNSGGEVDPIPPIGDIEMSLFEREGTWGPSLNPNFVGARRGLFKIELSVTRPDARTIPISGRQEFFVISRDSMLANGTIHPYFQLVGQVDMSATNKDKSKPTEETTWGSLKVFYR